MYDVVNIDRQINMTRRDGDWMTAAEGARALGVNRATLYAYVSRGFIRSEARPGRTRNRRYSAEDVERLRRRNEERRDPAKAAERALQWGLPVLESGITLIAGGRLYYRGHDATQLASTRSLEQVASLIWTGTFDSTFSDTPLHVVSGTATAGLPFTSRAQSVLAVVSARDPLAWDLRPHPVAQSGWRILNLMTSVAAESADLSDTVDETLARAWRPKSSRAAELIRAALILSADHELNVSAFTARCVASAGANPYSVVIGGLAAIEGTKHGGEAIRVENLLAELRRSRDVRRALAERLRRGERINGFGHRLYPTGDPRATSIMTMLRGRFPKSAELAFVESVLSAGESLTGEKATIDFALAALARVLKLPAGSPLTLFAIGRTIGWIGHAIEQYGLDVVIRPRARYVGERPE
jgi:citrate synthase